MTAIGQSHCLECMRLPDVTAEVHSWGKAKGRRSIRVESDTNMCAAIVMFGNSSATTTNSSKDVLGSYAHCTETTAKTRTEFGTNCSAARMHKLAICRQPKMLSSTMSHEQITRPAVGTIPWKRQLIRQVHLVMAGM